MTKKELLECRKAQFEAVCMGIGLRDIDLRRVNGAYWGEAFEQSLKEKKKELERLESRALELRERVLCASLGLSLPEQKLIELRYIKCLSWRRVADEMHFCLSYVRGKLHDSAIQHLSERK